MTRKLKPVEVDLPEEAVTALRAFPFAIRGELKTIGDAADEALGMIREINRVLAENDLMKVLAQSYMKKSSRRGEPRLQLTSAGKPVLCVSYFDGDAEEVPSETRLPSLDALREMARERGVDVSDLGRQKLNIMDRLGLAR